MTSRSTKTASPAAPGIRALRVVITILAAVLVVGHIYTSVMLKAARAENERLHREGGYLALDDPTALYAARLPTTQPLYWRWRIFAPGQYFVRVDTSNRSITTSRRIPLPSAESILNAQIVWQPPDGWVLFCGGQISNPVTLPTGLAELLLAPPSDREERLAREPIAKTPGDQPLVLLSLKRSPQAAAGAAADVRPTDGLVLTLEKTQ